MIRSKTGKFAKDPMQIPQKIWITGIIIGLAMLGGMNIGWKMGAPIQKEHSPLGSNYKMPVIDHKTIAKLPKVTPTIVKKEIKKVFVSNNKGNVLDIILPITREYGIPDQLTVSQWAVESGRATTSPINNYFGIGPFIVYPTVEANARDYALTVVNIAHRNGLEVKEGVSAKQILVALQSGKTRYEGHNPEPTTYINTVTNTPEWRSFE